MKNRENIGKNENLLLILNAIKWKFAIKWNLLLIPISIFKVFISCVLGYILLILTNYCPRRDNLELRNFYDWKTVAS